MPPRFFVPISKGQLAIKIARAAQQQLTDNHEEETVSDQDEETAMQDVLGASYVVDWKGLTPAIQRDLSKVEFDFENVEMIDGYSIIPESDRPKIMGFQELPNGFSFLGITAGGDWELPVFFIIYWDGHKLRGYIPTKGNIWNPINDSAVGNNEAADLAFLKKLNPNYEGTYADASSFYDILWIKADEILSDITHRILLGEKL
jgi:hypothetical protein